MGPFYNVASLFFYDKILDFVSQGKLVGWWCKFCFVNTSIQVENPNPWSLNSILVIHVKTEAFVYASSYLCSLGLRYRLIVLLKTLYCAELYCFVPCSGLKCTVLYDAKTMIHYITKQYTWIINIISTTQPLWKVLFYYIWGDIFSSGKCKKEIQKKLYVLYTVLFLTFLFLSQYLKVKLISFEFSVFSVFCHPA